MNGRDRHALWSLAAGFTIWSGAFVLLYALQALGCAYGWPHHRAILLIVYAAALIPLGYLALFPQRAKTGPVSTLSRTALWANRAAFASGILTFLPATFATICL